MANAEMKYATGASVMEVTKIISGGQTGADRGGLDAALHLGIPCGGWCPKGRLAEDDVIPDEYPLKEHTSRSYLEPVPKALSPEFKGVDER